MSPYILFKEDTPKALMPLVEVVQTAVADNIPDRVDETYIQSTIEMHIMNPVFSGKEQCIYPDVVISVRFIIRRYAWKSVDELREECKTQLGFNTRIDTTLYEQDAQKFVSDTAKNYYIQTVHSNLVECLQYIVAFAKGKDIKPKEEAV